MFYWLPPILVYIKIMRLGDTHHLSFWVTEDRKHQQHYTSVSHLHKHTSQRAEIQGLQAERWPPNNLSDNSLEALFSSPKSTEKCVLLSLLARLRFKAMCRSHLQHNYGILSHFKDGISDGNQAIRAKKRCFSMPFCGRRESGNSVLYNKTRKLVLLSANSNNNGTLSPRFYSNTVLTGYSQVTGC